MRKASRARPSKRSDKTGGADEETARARLLPWLLRALGGFDLLALAAVVMPGDAMGAAHLWLGLGELPNAPIVPYLARSASAMYALHGATVVFASLDVARYRPLIRFLAILAVVHGAAILAIDMASGMPAWWTLLEGPCFAATGLAVLAVMRIEA